MENLLQRDDVGRVLHYIIQEKQEDNMIGEKTVTLRPLEIQHSTTDFRGAFFNQKVDIFNLNIYFPYLIFLLLESNDYI